MQIGRDFNLRNALFNLCANLCRVPNANFIQKRMNNLTLFPMKINHNQGKLNFVNKTGRAD